MILITGHKQYWSTSADKQPIKSWNKTRLFSIILGCTELTFNLQHLKHTKNNIWKTPPNRKPLFKNERIIRKLQERKFHEKNKERNRVKSFITFETRVSERNSTFFKYNFKTMIKSTFFETIKKVSFSIKI